MDTQAANRPHRGGLDLALGLAGAVVGAALGVWLVGVIARQGFYAIVLPGALAGLFCGGLSGRRSTQLGVACTVVGLLAGIVAEWRIGPFIADASFGYFLAHLHQLRAVTQVLIVLGAALGCWFGLGRPGGAWPRRRTSARD